MSAGGEHLKDEGSKRQTVLAGGIAGLVSRFCIAPLDVVKIRLQLQIHSLSDPSSLAADRKGPGPTYKGTFSTMRAIIKEEGFTGLWKGNVPAELLYVTYGAVQFATYRSTTQALASLGSHTTHGRRLPASVESFIAGAVSGGAATTVTYPLDLLRTRFAAQGVEPVYSSLGSGVLDIVRSEGPLGLFRGCSAAVAQIVPFMGLFFSSYEMVRTLLAVDGLPFGSGDAVAGVLASVTAKTGVFPLDLARKRLQVQGPTRTRYVHHNIPEYRGVFDVITSILRTQGVRGLYRGLAVSLFKAAPAGAITMWTYENSLRVLREMDVSLVSADAK